MLGCVARPEGRRMRRREFIVLSMGAAVSWPLAARAQQPAFPVIGFLSSASFEAMHDYVSVFKHSLAEAGVVEGRNVAIDHPPTGTQWLRCVLPRRLLRLS